MWHQIKEKWNEVFGYQRANSDLVLNPKTTHLFNVCWSKCSKKRRFLANWCVPKFVLHVLYFSAIVQNIMELLVLLQDYHVSTTPRGSSTGSSTRITFWLCSLLPHPCGQQQLSVLLSPCPAQVDLTSLFFVLPICCLSPALGLFC